MPLFAPRWCRSRSGIDANGPPTSPPCSWNSSMMSLFQSGMSHLLVRGDPYPRWNRVEQAEIPRSGGGGDAMSVDGGASALHGQLADGLRQNTRRGRERGGRHQDLAPGGIGLQALGDVHGVAQQGVFEPYVTADTV